MKTILKSGYIGFPFKQRNNPMCPVFFFKVMFNLRLMDFVTLPKCDISGGNGVADEGVIACTRPDTELARTFVFINKMREGTKNQFELL